MPFAVSASAKMANKQRAFLKWAGGKYRLIEQITCHFPKKARLIEPFVGAGSIFLNSDFEHYLLADINPDLINLFKTIQHDVESYLEALVPIFFHPKANTPEFYYAQRQAFNESLDPFERSVRFVYLNRFGFNGLCRYNKQHQYNVPFGAYHHHYFPEQELRAFAHKAQRAEFVCASFDQICEQLLAEGDSCSVLYADPPYAPLMQESNFTQYAGGGFSLAQQWQLANYAKQLQAVGIPVFLSNHDTPFTREIYQGATLHTLQVRRSIGKNPSSRNKVSELLAVFA